MEILLFFLAFVIIIIIAAMIKYLSDPKMRKAANTIIEYREKEKLNNNIPHGRVRLDNETAVMLGDGDRITSNELEDMLSDLSDCSEGDNWIELPIRGINFRNLTDANIGCFEGYIAPDKTNKYDRYAIGIHGNDGTHFGFIEKGQKLLYHKIETSGGIINVSIEVYPFINDEGANRLSGTITISKIDLL